MVKQLDVNGPTMPSPPHAEKLFLLLQQGRVLFKMPCESVNFFFWIDNKILLKLDKWYIEAAGLSIQGRS